MAGREKKHYGPSEKEKAITFFRSEDRSARQASWILLVPVSTLTGWNKCFDEKLNPLEMPDNRGKSGKVTVEIVQRIVEKAKKYPHRIRLKQFCADLKGQDGIDIGIKTLEEILIANNLYKARTRVKRPKYYQSLRQKTPNGLLSIDGSEMIVWLGETPHRFNLELSVDVASFNHTAFSVGDEETAEEIIKVLEAHRKDWGTPIGVLSDKGSSNLSERVREYMRDLGIVPVTAGPGNPKGNGTDEGAFSHMKKVLGRMHFNVLSPRALARSILEALVSVYVYMRNRLSLGERQISPDQHMSHLVSEKEKDVERQRLRDHMASKSNDEEDQLKRDRLHWVIRHYNLYTTPEEMKRAERTIKGYELEAINQTETAFLKSTQRNAKRRNLPYFFGILKNIQQKLDDDAKRDYCRQRFNYQIMLQLERQKNEKSEPVSIENIINMLEKTATAKTRYIKELAIRKAREWTLEITASNRYLGPIKRKVEDALGKLTHLSIEQRENAWELFCQFLNANE